MPVAWRWLVALLFCAVDTLYAACVSLVYDAVVPRAVYRLKHQQTQSLLVAIVRPQTARLKLGLRFCAIRLKKRI
jgi:hypothetical protein